MWKRWSKYVKAWDWIVFTSWGIPGGSMLAMEYLHKYQSHVKAAV